MNGITIRFPPALRRAITRQARKNGYSFGQQVRRIAEQWLRRQKKAA